MNPLKIISVINIFSMALFLGVSLSTKDPINSHLFASLGVINGLFALKMMSNENQQPNL
jgi:hypothetical protein